MEATKKPKKQREFPHIYIILFSLIFIVWLASFIIPSGIYDRYEDPATGRMLVDPTSYHTVDMPNLTFMDLMTAVHDGFVQAADIIIMTFLIGATFGVLRKIGVIDVAVKKLAYILRHNGIIVLPILMLIFGIVDMFTGTCELAMVYLPIIMPLVLALGYDKMTAVAVVLCGGAAGFTAAFANPFTVIIAQKIAGLPLYSGAGYRMIIYFVVYFTFVIFIMRYASKVKADPKQSVLYDPNNPALVSQQVDESVKDVKFTRAQAAGGIGFLAIFAAMVIAVTALGMGDFNQLDAFFLGMCIVTAALGGLSGQEFAEGATEGAAEVLMGALVIGISRGVVVIMASAGIMDTIVYGLATVVQGLPSGITVLGMQLTQYLINFLIPSGSGQAVVTMPIMLPLADITGVTRQTAILAFQWGDGLTNIFWPTNGFFMAVLGLAGLAWNKWIKFFWKIFLVVTIEGSIFLLIAQAIGWQ